MANEFKSVNGCSFYFDQSEGWKQGYASKHTQKCTRPGSPTMNAFAKFEVNLMKYNECIYQVLSQSDEILWMHLPRLISIW